MIEALKLLSRDHVVHFDLKCANVLVDPLPGVTDTQLWAPLQHAAAGCESAAQSGGARVSCEGGPGSRTSSSGAGRPPFRIALADFGEARSYLSADVAFTARNRCGGGGGGGRVHPWV